MVSFRFHLAQPGTAALKSAPGQATPARGGADSFRAGMGHGLGIVLLCVAAGSGLAAQDPQAFFDRWWAAQTNLQTWSADLIQTRSLKVLAQPLVSTGKVWVRAPDRFRWELGQPVQTIALRQLDQMFVIYPRLNRAEKYSLTDVPAGPWKDALALLDASFPRDRKEMEALFNLVSVAETNATLQVTVQPKSASARKFIAEILVVFRTNDFALAATALKFADGSSLRNDFTNTVLNAPLAQALFEAKLPPECKVVEPLHP